MAVPDARVSHVVRRLGEARDRRGLVGRRHQPPTHDLRVLDVGRRIEGQLCGPHGRDYNVSTGNGRYQRSPRVEVLRIAKQPSRLPFQSGVDVAAGY